MAFDLSSIATTGQIVLPPRVVIHGPHGIGKSTFGANAPSPIFIPTEDGLTGIKVQSFPVAQSYDDIISALRALAREPHSYRTVVIDSADWAESLVWKATAEAHGMKSIEDFGYGKGYIFALDYWRKILTALDYLRTERKMASLILCHTDIRRFDSPETDPYDRYQLKLNARAGALVQEWADVVGFANHRVVIREKDAGFNKKVARGVSTGQRLIYYHERPAFQAKTRYPLPDSTPLSWADFVAAFREATTTSTSEPITQPTDNTTNTANTDNTKKEK